MNSSQRLSLPLLFSGQSQKEFVHNEALQALDVLVAAAVLQPPADIPPSNPSTGDCHLVGASPVGVWTPYAKHIAAFTAAGWRFVPPIEGLTALVRSTGTMAQYRNGAWEIGALHGSSVLVDGDQVVGARTGAIENPTGGGVVDAEARNAVAAILTALRQHGLIAA